MTPGKKQLKYLGKVNLGDKYTHIFYLPWKLNVFLQMPDTNSVMSSNRFADQFIKKKIRFVRSMSL